MKRTALLILFCSICSCSKNKSTGDVAPDSSVSVASDSRDTQTEDTSESHPTEPLDTATPSATSDTYSDGSGKELLYNFPALEGVGGDMYSLDVDDSYIYYATRSTLFRAEKDGSSDPTSLWGKPSGVRYQTLAFSGDNVFWLSGDDVIKWNKITDVLTTLSLDGKGEDVYVIASDNDALYLAEAGCRRIIKMSHDGANIQETSIEIQGAAAPPCGAATLTTDDQYLYCSGGGCDPTMGRVYRWPKQGGEISEFVSLPEIETPASNAGPQVTGMAIVDDKMFMISNFSSDGLLQFFGVANLADGAYTRISELRDTIGTKRLPHDPQRDSLYFFALGNSDVRGMYKYDLKNESLSRTAIEGGVSPMAADDDYLYWHTRSQIYRLSKF